MKGERIRYRQTGEFHFLTFSSFRRRPYLSAGAPMELFEDALERVRFPLPGPQKLGTGGTLSLIISRGNP